jgi:RNA polymerase sigma factor (sigma-70 family)
LRSVIKILSAFFLGIRLIRTMVEKNNDNEYIEEQEEQEEEDKAIQVTPEQMKVFNEELMPQIDALYNFAYHLTYNEDDANDLVQETYLKAYRFVDKYVSGTNAKAWLFKILKNAFINQYRKRSKRPQQVDYEEIASYHDSEEGSYVDYVDLRQEIFQGMMGDEVTIAINALPVDFRTVILLCDIEGFTYEEISKIIDIPIGTVRSRLHRARNMLKEKLKDYAASLGYEDKRGKKGKD